VPKIKRKAKMTTIAARIEPDVQPWVSSFIERTGTTQAKIVNEALRCVKPVLEQRLREGSKLFTKMEGTPQSTGCHDVQGES
jgi:hypothetical protein